MTATNSNEARAKHPGCGLRSVLFPVDLTAISDRVLGRLAFLPLAEDARVTLLHVVPDRLPRVEQLIALREAERALIEDVKHLPESVRKRTRIQRLVKIGGVATEIATCATDVQAELTVMGRGGRRLFRDLLVGSTAERVVRQARRPVLVVRRAARSVYRRPALALDLEQAAHDIVLLMLRLLPASRPEVEVVHAFDGYRSMVPSSSVDHQLFQYAKRELGRLLATALEKANVPAHRTPLWRTIVRHGSPRFVVEGVTRRADSDLLVLGTRGPSGLGHVFLGTVAGDLLRAARCDVLIVPPRD